MRSNTDNFIFFLGLLGTALGAGLVLFALRFYLAAPDPTVLETITCALTVALGAKLIKDGLELF